MHVTIPTSWEPSIIALHMGTMIYNGLGMKRVVMGCMERPGNPLLQSRLDRTCTGKTNVKPIANVCRKNRELYMVQL